MATCQKARGPHPLHTPLCRRERERERDTYIYIYLYISESIFRDKPPQAWPFRENLERDTGYVTCGRLKGYGQTVRGAERNNTGFWHAAKQLSAILVPDALYGYGMRASNRPQRDIVFALCASWK